MDQLLQNFVNRDYINYELSWYIIVFPTIMAVVTVGRKDLYQRYYVCLYNFGTFA